MAEVSGLKVTGHVSARVVSCTTLTIFLQQSQFRVTSQCLEKVNEGHQRAKLEDPT